LSGTELGSGTEADDDDGSTENRFLDFSEFDLTEFVLFEFEMFEFEMFTTVLGGILSSSNIVELLE
jgi:hypothetical protein